jgi:2-methylcitrate dehydratase PrpD
MLNTYIKPYPCCRHLHGPIDAVLKISEEDRISIDQVDGVLVETYEVASHHKHKKVDNILDAQMSIPYVVTMALRDREMGFEQFASSARSDPQVLSWLDRVEVMADEKLTANYPRTRPALVTIRCKNGQELSELVEQPWGEPSNPMSDDAVAEKALNLCEPFIGSERTDILVSSVMEGNDLKSLIGVLAEPALVASPH